MKVRYYLSRNKIENLYCRLTDGDDKVVFSLGLAIDPINWSAYKESMRIDHVYNEALSGLRYYLKRRFKELKQQGEENILEQLRNEVHVLIKDFGFQGVVRYFFDRRNGRSGIPKYDDHVQAFEQYTGLAKEDYRIRVTGSKVYFYTDDEVYLMNTYKGKKAELEYIFSNKSFFDIRGTEHWFWRSIFDKRPVRKNLVSEVLYEWVEYWDMQIQEVLEKGGNVSGVEKLKADSWKELKKFAKKYDRELDPFLASGALGLLYGLVVYVLVMSFDIDEILAEYCNLYFAHLNGWEPLFFTNGRSVATFQITSISSLEQVQSSGSPDTVERYIMEWPYSFEGDCRHPKTLK